MLVLVQFKALLLSQFKLLSFDEVFAKVLHWQFEFDVLRHVVASIGAF